MKTDTPERDLDARPLTNHEKLVFSLGHFDLALHSLRTRVDALLRTRRKLTGVQSAVLTLQLDELAQEAARSAPKWPHQS